MARRRRQISDAVLTPNNCVVLGVDPGKSSGFGITYQAHMLVHGSVNDTPQARDRTFAVAHDCQLKLIAELREEIPLVFVLEKFTPGAGKHFSARTRDGLAQRAGAWIDAWLRSGGRRDRIVRAYPHTWRGPVLGRANGSSELMKSLAIMYVAERYGVQTEDENEAEGMCISTWGVTATEVGLALGART